MSSFALLGDVYLKFEKNLIDSLKAIKKEIQFLKNRK